MVIRPHPQSRCPDVKSSWNRQRTAAKRRSAALTLSGYFCTSSRTLLALPCAASMTSRLGLSCSVHWDSSFSSTEMTVPEQRHGQKGRRGGVGAGCEKGTENERITLAFSLQFEHRTSLAERQKSHLNWLMKGRMSQNVPAWTGIGLHTFTNVHQSVVSLPYSEPNTNSRFCLD